ncbi:DNA-dependent protein kinase catalytic subunit-like [Homalodisca vitripennis]|uniref:DNA-dependent protein kinase catalytic subunit-like n=1 Tax=Homalodisca vitripennis TaxID=197043 RepID=UPI001EEA8D99|nr:DNA-dependent protein kinase catalytic subunit-like [Homalodisca vitripennis]
MMKMIFQLGQGYVSLAHSGMDALERWQDKLPSDQLKPILYQVLPSFDPYLRSTGILIEEESEEEIKLSKVQQKRAKRIAESTQLSKLQERMLKLLSKLDSATCLSLLRQENTSAVAWTTEPILKLMIPFPDHRLDVYLDALLPRVVALALTSSDRQTKSAACEVLHALVILFTGLDVRMPEGEALTSLWRHLMPALLQLGCGSDLVARQLFHLLVMQLMHWFSSKKMMSRPQEPAAVLEAIWDGVTHESDTALQDFSAVCLREFVSWAIKQSSDKELAASPASIKGVVRQINTYCVHASLSKRVGAAIAFNHLAPLLREHLTLVEKFWVELLFNLVRNLALSDSSDNHPACLALDQVLRVVQKNADLFNKVSSERRVPVALQSGQLRDVLHWLLLQCGNTSVVCAKKCRHLVKALTPLVPDINQTLDFYSKRLTDIENDVDRSKGRNKRTQGENIELLKSDNVSLRREVSSLKKKLNANAQYFEEQLFGDTRCS